MSPITACWRSGLLRVQAENMRWSLQTAMSRVQKQDGEHLASMAQKVVAFEKSSTGFKSAPEQLSACRWFGEATDVALQEEENRIPLPNCTQHACLLIGVDGTGKTAILLDLTLDIKPANEISLADSLEELVRKRPDKVQTEHCAAQAALMSMETVIRLKKSKRFLDVHLPEITTAMRMRTPTSPLSEDHLDQLRSRRKETCKKELETDLFKHDHVVGMYWESIACRMVERAHRAAQLLDVP
eukprot:symbB.v1.2.035650.t1/scaffold4846.1/size33919/1